MGNIWLTFISHCFLPFLYIHTSTNTLHWPWVRITFRTKQFKYPQWKWPIKSWITLYQSTISYSYSLDVMATWVFRQKLCKVSLDDVTYEYFLMPFCILQINIICSYDGPIINLLIPLWSKNLLIPPWSKNLLIPLWSTFCYYKWPCD